MADDTETATVPAVTPCPLAVTGLGAVTPLGIGRAALAEALAAGRVGVGDLTLFAPPEDAPCEHAAEIHGYDWTSHLRTKQAYADRTTQLALGAARLALADADLVPPAENGFGEPRIGICLGSKFAALETGEKFFEPVTKNTPKLASALFFSHAAPNVPAAFCAVELGLTGHSSVFTGDALAGRRALVSAARAVERGAGPAVLAGAAEAVTPWSYRHQLFVGELPDTRDQTPPPTLPGGVPPEDGSLSRWGKVPGEAAVFVLVEREADARARGARILGRWDGSAELIDAFDAARRRWESSWIFGDAGAAVIPLSALAGGWLSL